MQLFFKKYFVKILKSIAVLTLLISLQSSLFAEEYLEYKTVYIYKFLRFIRWHSDTVYEAEKFLICTMGETRIDKYLKIISEKKKVKIRSKSKSIKIKALDDVEKVEECQVIYIGKIEEKKLAKIISKTERKEIVTIGATKGYASKGVLINIYLDGSKIKFEINLKAVKKSGLDFSSKLYKLARIIDYGE